MRNFNIKSTASSVFPLLVNNKFIGYLPNRMTIPCGDSMAKTMIYYINLQLQKTKQEIMNREEELFLILSYNLDTISTMNEVLILR